MASNRDESRFKVVILKNRPTLPSDSHFDIDNSCIIVSPKTDLREGEWRHIRLALPGVSFNPRAAQVLFNDLIEDSNCVYISPQLWHNLRYQPLRDKLEQVFWKFPLEQPDAQLVIESTDDVQQQLQNGKSVQVNLLNCPDYPHDFDYNQILHNYFANRARCLRLNDTFGVPASSDPLFMWNNSLQLCSSNYHSTVIYFQVCQINDVTVSLNEDFYFAPKTKTKLFKSSNVNGCCPSMLSQYHHQPTAELLIVPEALRSEVTTLANLIRPYLLRISSLRTGTFLLSDPSGGCAAKRIIVSAAQFWHLNVYEQSAIDLLCEMPQTTEAKIRHSFSKANLYAPCIVLITDLNILYRSEIYRDNRILGLLRSTIDEFSSGSKTWPVLVAATARQEDPTHPLTALFRHKMELEPANEEGRQLVLETLLTNRIFNSISLNDRHLSRLHELVKLTSGLGVEHIEAIVCSAAKQLPTTRDDDESTEASFSAFCDTLKESVDTFREQNLDLGCGTLQVPNVSWSDIGGLEDVKQDILETIEMPLKLGLRFSALGIRRSGVLLHGPPGTGKTLLAKAVAAQCSLNFISVKGPELINKYVGQSEENVRNLFAQARRSSPSIIFFDELDSLAPARGKSGDSGGVMDRVVSQLLTELDGISSGGPKDSAKKWSGSPAEESMVFVIGATNRIDLIDSALLRPGRFDKCLQVPIATDQLSRLAILRALTKRFEFADQTSEDILRQIEQASPPVMSGADFYSLCSGAMFNALRRTIEEVEEQRRKSSGNGVEADDLTSENEENLVEEDREQYRIKVRLEDFEQVLAASAKNRK
ncbi:peroxisomal assembly protein [Tyrophagus putrescentiae]|nr:peroxisomal assembly protein [Tyrophagus putrescentiae]